MLYGVELVKSLEDEITRLRAAMDRRQERYNNWETDEDDCFISERVESRGIQLDRDKISLIQDGGMLMVSGICHSGWKADKCSLV